MLFGPITAVWFLAMGIGGAIHFTDEPRVFQAVNPLHGIGFIATNGVAGMTVMGLVFFAVTGAEALYADLGHFGRKPIQTAWLWFIFPALVCNYFGQGALLLSTPEAIESPFYRLYPEWALIPMVILATMATVIACQAVITGAFSITRQAVQLGILPRMAVHGRPDLPAARQLAAARPGAVRRRHLPLIEQPCRRLRCCRHRRDADRQLHGLLRHLEAVAVAVMASSGLDAAAGAHRAILLHGQHA
jgi:hypothetical protein